MQVKLSTVRQMIWEEISIHKRAPSHGGLRGTSGRSNDWEDGYIQGLNQVLKFMLPAAARAEKGEPELDCNLPPDHSHECVRPLANLPHGSGTGGQPEQASSCAVREGNGKCCQLNTTRTSAPTGETGSMGVPAVAPATVGTFQ